MHEQIKPSVSENDIVAEVNKFVYTQGREDGETMNSISAEGCNSQPHK